MTQVASAIERRAWMAFSLVAVLALAVGWLTYANSRRLLDDQDAVAQSHETIAALGSTLSSLQAVETGSRGYVLTANPDFLKPYTAGIEQLGKELAHLKLLTEGDSAQIERLATLELLAAEKVEISRVQVDSRDAQGPEAAGQIVASGRGKAVMDDARAVVATMIDGEEARLRSRTSSSDASTRNTLILTGTLAVLCLALFAFLLAAIMRVLRAQRRAAETSQRLGTVLDASSDAIIGVDLDGMVTTWNRSAERMFGYSAAEVAGKHVSIICLPDQAAQQQANLAAARAGQEVIDQETVRLARDGRAIDVSISSFPVRSASGEVVGIAGVFRDIAARKQAEQDLRDSEQRWATIFNRNPAGISITRASDGLVIDANRRLLDLLGFEREDFVGHTPADIGLWVDPSLRPAMVQRLREQGSLPDTEVRLRTSSGKLIDTLLAWETLNLGGETYIVALVHDITARKQAERDLRESEHRWATIFNHSPAGISITRASDGVLLDVNTRMLEMFGATRDEVVGRTSLDLGNWADPATRATVAEALAAQGSLRDMETQWRARSGGILDTISSWDLLNLGGEPCVLTLITDITERKQAEDALRESQQRFVTVFNVSPAAIAIVRLSDGTFLDINVRFLEMFGLSHEGVIGRTSLELGMWPDRSRRAPLVRRIVAEGSVRDDEAQWRTATGRLIDAINSWELIELGGEPSILVLINDVTARKEAERDLKRLFDLSSDLIAVTSFDGTIRRANPAALRALGYTEDEFLAIPLLDLPHPEDQPSAAAELARLAGSEPSVTFEGRVCAKDGSYLWLELVAVGDPARQLAYLVARDVTARREMEAARRADAERFRSVVETAEDAIIMIDSRGIIESFNRAAESIFGYPASETVGRNVSMLVPSPHREAHDGYIARFLATGERRLTPNRELSGLRKDGSEFPMEFTVSVIRGEPEVRFTGIVRDITARKQMEEALRTSEERFRSVIESATDAIIITDRLGIVELFNPAAERMFGYTAAEATGQDITVFIPSAEEEGPGGPIIAFLNKGDTDVPGLRREMTGRRKDGSVFLHELTANAMQLAGELKFTAIVRDITARKQLEDDLRETDLRFSSVIETATDAIIITDRFGTIEMFNPAAERMFGYTAAEATGQDITVFIPSAEEEGPGGPIVAFLNKGDTDVPGLRREMTGRRKDGSVFLHELTANSMELAGELKFTAIVRDITARKQLEDELLQAKEVAEHANLAKSSFLSRMSHELRTPLNVVLGFGQVLRLDPLEPQQAEAVDHILKAGRHLLELIDEVLDISRIEAGRMSFSIEPVRADELLADAVTLMRPLASQREITIQAEADPCNCFVVADRQRLRQVLLNLLANAIKYNREGGAVHITCAKVADSALRISVTDTGRGIAPENIDRLFVAFERLGAEVTAVEGTGLGLALSRQLIEAMGGVIGAESTIDVGSTFWIELALTDEPAESPEGVSSEAPGGGRRPTGQRTVLYVEDNLANLSLMERILVGRLGFRLLAAMQGSLGLDLASDHHPDLILLDLHLPDMPGNEVLRQLHDNPATRDIPVIVVSADATPGQIARLRAAGARAYVTKPFDLNELFDAIDSILPEAN